MSWNQPPHPSRPSSRSPPRHLAARPHSRSRSTSQTAHDDPTPRDKAKHHAAHPDRDSATKQVDQIVQHFFAKTLAVVSQSRTTTNSDVLDVPSGTPSSSAMRSGGGRKKGERLNSWFNLTLPENEQYRPELKTWRNVSTLLSPTSPASTSSSFLSTAPSSSSTPSIVPTLSISVYLDVSDLTPNQVLVLSDQKGRRTRVDRHLATRDRTDRPSPSATGPRSRSRGGGHSQNPTSVVLERWTLAFQPTRPSSPPPPPSHAATSSSTSSSTSDLGKRSTAASSSSSSMSLPSVYKHSILHFRSLYTLVKLLPTYSLARKLNRSSHSSTGSRGGTSGVGNHGGPTMGGLRIRIRVEVSDPDDGGGREPCEGEVEVGVPIESGGTEENGRTTETVRFPGVGTPLGVLHLTATYRLNTDFAVEDNETLLSSRFIDEEFFRPTFNTARFREQEQSGRPGSLPMSSRAGPAEAQVRLGSSPSHPSPPMTGLGPLPSYGSLSSRHQYAPVATAAVPSTIPALPPPVPRPPDSVGSDAEPRQSIDSGERSPSVVSSSSRLSATYNNTSVPPVAAPARTGGIVEPAFIALSRARSGSNIPGIQRASPSSYGAGTGGGGTSGIIRRTSLSGGGGGHSSSPSSGSPIFRPGSYLANPSLGGGGGAGGISGGLPGSFPSPSFGPPSRQQPQPASASASGGFPPPPTTTSGTSPITFGNRVSPLSPPAIPSGPSNLGATAPARQPIELVPPSSSSPSSSSSPVVAGIPIRGGYSNTSVSGGAIVGSGSWSRAYAGGGRGSSWDSGDAPPLSRRTSSRLSFGAGSGGGAGSYSGNVSRVAAGAVAVGSREDEKRFINAGTTPQDAGDINDFLKLLDEKPDLGGLAGSRLGQSAVVSGSTVLRKRDVEEQLRALRGSVLGFGTTSGAGGRGGGASSPSPPFPAFAVSSASGTASPRGGGGGGFGGISNLRRQTSRLSIEEEPVEYATVPSRDCGTQGSERGESSDNGLTPRPPYRQLRPDVVSPPLSTVSATSTVRHHPQPPPLLRADSPNRIALEPRLFPLPSSSATSPLASPAILPPFSSVYPPLPYPPAKKSRASVSTLTTESTRTEPIAFAPYLSRAARLAVQERETTAATASERNNSAAASVSSFSSTQGDDVDAGSYRGEEEAVGRLELDGEDEQGGGASSERGRTYRPDEVDEEEIALHSRDPTPAAAIRLGGAGNGTAAGVTGGASPYRRVTTAAGYFATRSHSRGGASPSSHSYLH